MPFIEVRAGEREGWFTELSGELFLIGRDPTADLRIEDGRTSRRHCEIFKDGETWKIRDLDSANGTRIRGKKIGEVTLKPGMEITVGTAVLLFRADPPSGSVRRKQPVILEVPADEDGEPEVTIVAGEDEAQEEEAGADDEEKAEEGGVEISDAELADEESLQLDTLDPGLATLVMGGEGAAAGERALAGLRCLFAVAKACSAARTPQEVLGALGEELSERLGADRLYVFLGAGAGQVAWSASEATFAADAGKVPVSRTVLRRARDENVAVLMTDPAADPETAAARSIEVNRIVTALAVPLSVGGRVVGVLYADRLGRAESFTNEDLELAAAAALLAAGSLSGAEELVRARAELDRLSEQLGTGEMLGESEVMQEIGRLIAGAGPTEAAVLVTGESGTGKELVARAIYRASTRAEKPFEVVNCAALAENLIESELFGHAEGAFTGASSARVGRFERADGGTIFLDEIGELSGSAQAKLLRVLEQGEISRVGESQVREVDVRVIAATNQDLEAEVSGKKFREDLYYRLNVLRIPLPPVRERGSDVEMLLDHFLKSAAERMGRPVPELEPAARGKLLSYLWPGNVREMRNLVERLVILSASGKIAVSDLPPEVSGAKGAVIIKPAETAAGSPVGSARKLNDIAKEHILAVLASAGNNKSKAAEILGIDRSTLYARLKEYEGA